MCVIQSYDEERRLRTELEMRCQRLTLDLADTKQNIQEGDYRRENYPSLKRFVCVFFLCVCVNVCHMNHSCASWRYRGAVVKQSTDYFIMLHNVNIMFLGNNAAV